MKNTPVIKSTSSRSARSPKSSDSRDLPSSTYAILGMLTFGEMSGYDLGKLVDRTVGHFFSPAKSQIYSELRRLVAHGWATERRVEQQDRPDKRLYRISSKGERALRAWLESPEVEPTSVKMPFLLKLFFGGYLPHETLLGQVKEAQRQAKEDLDGMRQLEREMGDKAEMFFPNLVLQFGMAHNRSRVRWTEQVLKEIEARGRQQAHGDE